MANPYTCIQACDLAVNGRDEWVLFGASGSSIVVQSSSGAATVWPASVGNLTEDGQDENTEGPPAKKTKFSSPTRNDSNFSCFTLSNDKKHLVAVTGEDKCIRVFQIDSEYQLQELSQRCMVRRPCAIATTADDSTILCADKFGDVYALPLIAPAEDDQNGTPATEDSEPLNPKQFVPSASVLTVHSGRNRKVLEEQLKQAAKKPSKSKEPMKFKHDLLLGHVSMLTDIVYTKLDGRSYIITADRDEHVRISRGPPQAHIIEGFCHGHEAFVSRLCLASPTLLVSGGGDDNIFVWDWSNYRLLETIPIRDHVLGFLNGQQELSTKLPEDDASFKIAVSGIWKVPSNRPDDHEVLVACEGVPALFSLKLSATRPPQVLTLGGNALSVAFTRPGQSLCTAVVSVDTLHTPGSTTEIRKDERISRLQCFSYREDGQWGEDAEMEDALEWFSCRARGGDADIAREAGGARTAADEKAMRDILYGVGHLRKQPGSVD